MASKLRPSATNWRNEVLTSASMKLAWAGSSPLSSRFARACSSAGPDESMLVTCPALPASAATLKPPV
ncbi:hypothetical protein FQZ97_1030000 [compost metagenome]